MKITVDFDQHWMGDFDSTISRYIQEEIKEAVMRAVRKEIKEEIAKRSIAIKRATSEALKTMKIEVNP